MMDELEALRQALAEVMTDFRVSAAGMAEQIQDQNRLLREFAESVVEMRNQMAEMQNQMGVLSVRVERMKLQIDQWTSMGERMTRIEMKLFTPL